MCAESFQLINDDIWLSMCKRLQYRGIRIQAFKSGGQLNISSPYEADYFKAVNYLRKMGVIGHRRKFMC
jgi:hypothetical protein